MVGSHLVPGSVVCGFNKTQEKNMFGVVISPVHFGRCFFFVVLILIFFYIDNKEETNLTVRSNQLISIIT